MKLLTFILAFISTQAFAHKVESYHPTYLSHSCIDSDARIEVAKFEYDLYSLYTDGDDVYDALYLYEENKHAPKDLIERMKKIWVKACIHHHKHYENEEECGGERLSKKEIEEMVEICELEPIDWGYRLGGLFIFDKEKDKEE